MPHELSAELYDAIYAYKDYAGEVVRIRELVEARRPGARQRRPHVARDTEVRQ